MSPDGAAQLSPWQVWWTDFDPQVGREQRGVRPAIIVGSKLACDLPNGLVSLVPCTTNNRWLPTQPEIHLDGKSCVAMCDQMRATSIDRLVKPHPATLSDSEVEMLRFVLRQLIDI